MIKPKRTDLQDEVEKEFEAEKLELLRAELSDEDFNEKAEVINKKIIAAGGTHGQCLAKRR